MVKKKLHARFGATGRYGKSIREQAITIERQYKRKASCPACSRVAIRRKAPGIWRCAHCRATFASGAYEFKV